MFSPKLGTTFSLFVVASALAGAEIRRNLQTIDETCPLAIVTSFRIPPLKLFRTILSLRTSSSGRLKL